MRTRCLLPAAVLSAIALTSWAYPEGSPNPMPAGNSTRADFYVSPQGRDSWSGTLPEPTAGRQDGPFVTMRRAIKAVRELRAGRARSVKVLIRGGTYRLSSPIVFRPEDSGAAAAPIVYAAYPGEQPVFSGGVPITGWTAGSDGIWRARVQGFGAGESGLTKPFHQLFVNGRRRQRARTPNEGFLLTPGLPPNLPNPQATPRPADAGLYMAYAGDEFQRLSNLDEANVFLYHSWTASLHWIAEVNEQEKTVKFVSPAHWPTGYWGGRQRYVLENYPEALDAPGEWYLDAATATLSYLPLPGEDPREAEFTAPRLKQLVVFRGAPDRGQYLEGINLEGLSFQHADWDVPNKGTADGQAAVWLTGAVHARGARHCALRRCEVAHIGAYGVWLDRGCQDNVIQQCEIHDLGAGGVKLGQTNGTEAEATAVARNVVDNCYIHAGGRVFPAGVGVLVLRSSYNQVTHNEICDLYYTAVSVGWSWGYAPSSAHDNIVEYNHLHHIGQGVLSDMGGIYTLGISPGTRLRYNLIHDIESFQYGGWGLYTDEGSSEILLENNIVHDTKTGGFHQHYGRENIVRNNIFAFSRQPNIIRSRQESHLSFTFEHNIVLCDNDQVLGGAWGDGKYALDHNLYWSTDGAEGLSFYGPDFAEWQAAGNDAHSLVADPLFRDARRGDFTLAPGSPALAIGYQPIDASGIGLYGEAEWVRRPLGQKLRDLPRPQARPAPVFVGDDFEATEVGQRPAGAAVSGEDGGASIRVTDETAASGRHSLKITDAPGLPYVWQPHMYYPISVRKGVATVSFSLRREAGARAWHEWRDAANPYRVGPSFRVEPDGALMVGETTLTTVPLGQWVHFEVTCTLGTAGDHTWRLRVTDAGGAPQEFTGLPCGSEAFTRLEWLGFISLANDKAAFYVDDVKLVRE